MTKMMRAYILAFAFGVGLLQQQAELPNTSWAWAIYPLAASAFLLLRCRAAFLTNRQVCLPSFSWRRIFLGGCVCQWRLADVLPHEWEGRDIQLVGVVAELPQANESSVRFAFDVEQVLTQDAVVPARISLAWYKARNGEDHPMAEAAPQQILQASAGN